MKLPSMRCTNIFRQDGGVDVSVHFHSADKHSIAVLAMKAEDAAKYEVGKFYEFSASEQKKRD